MNVRRVVRIMDLDADPATLAVYDRAHATGQTPRGVVTALHRHGIAEMEIFRSGNRLVMILCLTDAFDPVGLAEVERAEPELAAWQTGMAALQRAPFEDLEAWPEAHAVFRLSDHLLQEEML